MNYVKNILFFILAVLLVFSCTKSNDLDFKPEEEKPNEQATVDDSIEKDEDDADDDVAIINYPFTRYDDKGDNGNLNFTEFWGQGHNTTSIVFGEPATLGRKVINTEAIYKDNLDAFSIIPIHLYQMNPRIYKSEKELLSDSHLSANDIHQILSKEKLNQPNRMYGELIIDLKKNMYQVLMTSYRKNKVAERYLQPQFSASLYNKPMDKLIEEYAPYVLMDFFTGWRMILFYTGLCDETKIEQKTKEQEFLYTIAKTYRSEPAIDANGNSYNNAFVSGEYYKEGAVSNLEVCVRNIGGGGEFRDLKQFKDVKGTKFIVSDWIKSTDDNNYKIVEARDNGIIPIYDFMLEVNFKDKVKQYIEHKTKFSSLKQPHINIIKSISGGNVILSTYLITRFNDYVLIDSYTLAPNEDALQIAQKIINEKKKIYKIDIAYKEDSKTLPSKVYSFKNLDESKMKKFINPHNKMTYLLYADQNVKFAFSIYNDSVLEQYGMKEWVNGLPETTIYSRILYQHTIIGL